MRYARSTKEAVASALTGLLFGNILMIVCGAIATIAMNDYDLTNVLLGFGLVIPALILMTTNIFTTNVANLYSTSLNLANSFKAGRNKTLIVVIEMCIRDRACTAFTRCLTEELGYDAFAPYSGTSYDLAAGEFVTVTEGVRIPQKQPVPDVYKRQG